MSILVIVENEDKKLKKASYEAVSYASALAENLGSDVFALALGEFENGELDKIGKYGVEKVIHINDAAYNTFNSANYTNAAATIASNKNANIVVIPQTFYGRAYAPRVAVRTDAALFSGITSLVEKKDDGYYVKRIAFSNKAIETVKTTSDKVVITLKSGAFQPQDKGKSISVENTSVPATDTREKVVKKEKFSGGVPLPEASIVVSAGRGLKGPENWGMVEELAQLLGAATACSRPVAESGWRPHHEHVGQTGVQISPDVYIAIGISGAIQHLAGVSGSKTIIVINKDPEAPFFQNCDYGIVGDAFEVVPKLIEAIKKYKANH